MSRKSIIAIVTLIVLAVAILAFAQSMQAPGFPIPGNGTMVGGSDGTLFRAFLTDTSGRLVVTGATGATVADPCQSGAIAKKSAFANITTATTTALVAVSGTTTVYVCAYSINMVATVAADTLLFEQGTGSTCAGSPTALTSTFSSGVLANGSEQTAVSGSGTVFSTAASNGLCAVSTVGTGPTIGVNVTYVQQ